MVIVRYDLLDRSTIWIEDADGTRHACHAQLDLAPLRNFTGRLALFTVGKVAQKGIGSGLPPTITPGMRALSLRVNEVVGVAAGTGMGQQQGWGTTYGAVTVIAARALPGSVRLWPR